MHSMALCFLFVRFAEYRGALTIAMTNLVPHNNSEKHTSLQQRLQKHQLTIAVTNALAYNSSDKCNSLQQQ